jgi:hypothetical protein
MQALRNRSLSQQSKILPLVLAGLVGVTSQPLRTQSQDHQPAASNSTATQSLANHPLIGWWILDSEKTADEINSAVVDPYDRLMLLGNCTTFHFHFRDSGECTLLLGKVGEVTWSANETEPRLGTITIRSGNTPQAALKYVLNDHDYASLQPDRREPFRIFLRRLQTPITDPQQLKTLMEQLAGPWRGSAEKTKALLGARRFPPRPDIDEILQNKNWELKGDLLQPTNDSSPSLTLSPLVAEVDDWQAKDWNGIIIGKTNLGSTFSWENKKGESILVIAGMPFVVERKQTSR